jgi:hypothetical protein
MAGVVRPPGHEVRRPMRQAVGVCTHCGGAVRHRPGRMYHVPAFCCSTCRELHAAKVWDRRVVA